MLCSKHKKSESSSKAVEIGLKGTAVERRTKLAERKVLLTAGEEAVKTMREKRWKSERRQKAEVRASKRAFERGEKVGGGGGFEKTEKRMEYDRGLREGCPGGECTKGWLKKKGLWNKNDAAVWSRNMRKWTTTASHLGRDGHTLTKAGMSRHHPAAHTIWKASTVNGFKAPTVPYNEEVQQN